MATPRTDIAETSTATLTERILAERTSKPGRRRRCLVPGGHRPGAQTTWRMASFEEPATIPGTLRCPTLDPDLGEAQSQESREPRERRWLGALRRI